MLFLILLLAQAQLAQPSLVSDDQTGGTATGTTQLVIEGITEQVDRESYRLGPGDVLTLTFQGGCTSYMLASGATPVSMITVTSDGMVTSPGVGQLEVGGLTIAAAAEALAGMAARQYPGADLRVALAQPRSLRVTVRGMVDTPGTYVMSSVYRVSDLVETAGGLSVYGSRMGTMRTDDDDTLEVNLMFDPATSRRISDPYLTNNAVVSFPLAEDPVYVVRRGRTSDARGMPVPPVETWELPDSTGLSGFLDYTGGLSGNVDLSRSVLVRGDSLLAIWSPRTGIHDRRLFPGDTLDLVMISDSVVVSGAVRSTGELPYVPGWTVREYVARKGGFNANAKESDLEVVREGRVVASGPRAHEYVPLPGDVIEVPYNWIARNGSTVAVLSTTVGIISIVYNLLDDN